MFKPQTKAVAMPVLNKMYPYMVALSLMCLATSSAGAQVAVKKNADDSMSLQSGGAEQVRIMTDGKVGVNTIAPAVALDVSGSLMIANGGEVCDASTEGALRYTLANGVEYCNATSWGGMGTGLWTDNTSYISYEGVRLYKTGTTWDHSFGDAGLFYHEDKSALRIGSHNNGSADEANVGSLSFGIGSSVIASGDRSFAMGSSSVASANDAFAFGTSTASGTRAIAMGNGSQATAGDAIAMGSSAQATQLFAVALGRSTVASNNSSFAVGNGSTASGVTSAAIGFGSAASGNYSLAANYNTVAGGPNSVAMGRASKAMGTTSFAFGEGVVAQGIYSAIIGLDSTVSGTTVTDARTMAIVGGEVAINKTSANSELDVSGTVTATSFVGDGASLTGVVATPAGDDATLQFNNAGVLAGAPIKYNSTYDKFYARGGLNNYIVDHSTGGTYAGNMNIGAADPAMSEGALHLAVAGYNNTTDLRYMLGAVMIGNSDSVLDATPQPMVQGDYLPGIGFAGHTTTSLGTSTNLAATIHGFVDGTVSSGVLPTAITINTGSSTGNLQERMRIASTGEVGIGTTAPAVALDVSGSIQYTGDLTDVSDRRLKQNIQPLESELDKVSQVQAVRFEMKDRPGVVELGVIAQDIEEIYPELVKTADDDMQTKSVNYVGLIAPMLQAMRELKAEVETLKIQNAQQKVQIDQLMEKTNQ